MVKPVCVVHDLGQVPYQPAWDLQERMASEIAAGQRLPTLLLLEHPHTYTFGRRGQASNLLWGQTELAQRGINVHWVDRGGDVTYHGPGQLVGYPLLPLGKVQVTAKGLSRLPQADYVGYVRKLERCLIATVAQFGVQAQQIPGLTGLWVKTEPNQPPAKLAAIGIKVDARGISRHGFALNINPDMSYWQGIIACGLQGHPQTSLLDLMDQLPNRPIVIAALCQAFSVEFGYQLEFQQPPANLSLSEIL